MAGKSRYTDEDKARVYVALAANDGNVKRVARETGVPETTVRRLKAQFAEEGPPDVEVVDEALGDFLEKAEAVQWKAIRALENKIDAASPRDLITVIGVLNDKITRARGIKPPGSEHHHYHHLPPAEEIRDVLMGMSTAAVEAGRQRQAELVDAEIREQATSPLALPAPRT